MAESEVDLKATGAVSVKPRDGPWNFTEQPRDGSETFLMTEGAKMSEANEKNR